MFTYDTKAKHHIYQSSSNMFLGSWINAPVTATVQIGRTEQSKIVPTGPRSQSIIRPLISIDNHFLIVLCLQNFLCQKGRRFLVAKHCTGMSVKSSVNGTKFVNHAVGLLAYH